MNIHVFDFFKGQVLPKIYKCDHFFADAILNGCFNELFLNESINTIFIIVLSTRKNVL